MDQKDQLPGVLDVIGFSGAAESAGRSSSTGLLYKIFHESSCKYSVLPLARPDFRQGCLEFGTTLNPCYVRTYALCTDAFMYICITVLDSTPVYMYLLVLSPVGQ